MNEPWRTDGWVMAHVNESWHTHEWVMAHIHHSSCSMFQCVAACFSVLQHVSVCCSMYNGSTCGLLLDYNNYVFNSIIANVVEHMCIYIHTCIYIPYTNVYIYSVYICIHMNIDVYIDSCSFPLIRIKLISECSSICIREFRLVSLGSVYMMSLLMCSIWKQTLSCTCVYTYTRVYIFCIHAHMCVYI